MNKSSVSLTEGKISSKIFKFALPIFWGNLFQQLYNTVDAIIVGNFVGEEALAAVSSTASLTFLIVGFFGGLSGGCGVIISRFFGEKNYEKVKSSVGNTIAFGLIVGVLLTIVGTMFTPYILKLMGTPENVMVDSVAYITTYFKGIAFVVLYNVSNGILQAVGNSKTPLIFLLISSAINVVLDLLFVAVFEMGVVGAALATIISQAISAILAISYLLRVKDVYRLHINTIKIDLHLTKEMLRIGIPTGIQNSVISLANVFVQANINTFGSIVMAGTGSYSRLEGFAFIPVTSFTMAMTTFVSQNLGAKKYDRVKSGVKFGLISACIIAEIIGMIFIIFAPLLVGLFGDDPKVIEVGITQSTIRAPFYFLVAFSHVMAGVLRGAGKSSVPMYVMLLCWCVIRVIYITIATSLTDDIRMIFIAYPITWTLSSVMFAAYFKLSGGITEKSQFKKA